jgi:hypothetical protein
MCQQVSLHFLYSLIDAQWYKRRTHALCTDIAKFQELQMREARIGSHSNKHCTAQAFQDLHTSVWMGRCIYGWEGVFSQ